MKKIAINLTVLFFLYLISSNLMAQHRSNMKHDENKLSDIIIMGKNLQKLFGELPIESFEGTSFPPDGWKKVTYFGGTGWQRTAIGESVPGFGSPATIDSTPPKGGNAVALCSWLTGDADGDSHTDQPTDQWLITPKIMNIQEDASLRFYLRYFSVWGDNLDVLISTTNADSRESFDRHITTLSFSVTSPNDWIQYIFNLTDFVDPGSDIFIAFREHVSNNTNSGDALFLDLVEVMNTILSLISPNGGEFLAGGQIMEINWSTTIIVDHIRLFYSTDSGYTYANLIAEGVPNTGSYNWTLPQINSSTIRVKVQAEDENNIVIVEDESESNFTIDSIQPNIFSLQSPPNGTWGNPTPTFLWDNVSDNLSGIGKFQLWIDGNLSVDNIPPNTPFVTPTQPLLEGIHTWNVRTFDKAGNVRQSNETWSVKVDVSPPTTFNLISPSDNSWTSSSFPSFSWQTSSDAISGLRKYQLFINDSLNRDYLSPLTNTSTPISALPNDDFSWYIMAVDSGYNITRSNQTWTIRIDNTPPTTFNLISPENNSWTGNSTPTFTWEQSNDTGIGLSRHQLLIDFVLKLNSISPDSTSATLPFNLALSHGNHDWYVVALDQLNNSRPSNFKYTLRVDTKAPLSFSLRSPSDSSSVDIPTPNFSWYATIDQDAGLSHYQLWIDDSLSVDNIQGTTSAPSLPLTKGYHKWFVKAVDKVGNERKSNQVWTVGILVTDVETKEEQLVPTEFALSQNYPNPFNPVTTIAYQLPTASNVTLKIYNLRGQEIRTLVEEEKPAGYYSIQWDGLDKQGMKVSSGVYIYRITGGSEFTASKKMLFLQ